MLSVLILTVICLNINAQLPVIRLVSNNTLSSEFTLGHFQLDDSISVDAEIRYRGHSTSIKQKKSFAIKLIDNSGNKLDAPLLGMRSDNYWILDAMSIDLSRMRNRVSMDLWNDFSSTPYIKEKDERALNGTNGRFVEVYLNNEYWGLYCLTERIDRKQLRLKKLDGNKIKGVLYKSDSWTIMHSEQPDYYTYDNMQKNWNGWECSYPDIEDGEPIDWEPLVSTIHWLSFASEQEINDLLEKKIDIPVWVDYYLFMEFICAEDNICKNQYVYFYNSTEEDRMLGIVPWDMDHSWGRDYEGKITERTAPDFYNDPTYNHVCDILKNKYNKLQKSFAERYTELRTNQFSALNLKNRFRTYFDLFFSTGVAAREEERWNGADGISLNFKAEQEYIENWIDERLEYMDNTYGCHITTPISTINETSGLNDRIYSIDGTCIEGKSNFHQLSKGVYIINGKKIVR